MKQDPNEAMDKFFSSPPDKKSQFRAENKKKPTTITCCIYSLEKLVDLLAEKTAKNEKPDLRFIVDSAGVAWFARESHFDTPAPAHYQMTGDPQNQAYCKAAGNMEFSDSTCSVLTKINNKSGDFCPSFASLKWILGILLLNEKQLPFKFAKTLIVENSGCIEATQICNIEKIRLWATSIQDQDIVDRLIDQQKSTKEVSYQGPKRLIDSDSEEELHSPKRPKIRRTLFGDVSEKKEQDKTEDRVSSFHMGLL